MAMDASLRQRVWERAGDRCEYCQLRQEQSPFARLQIEHIWARQHGGGDNFENLALACIDCKLRKGPPDRLLSRLVNGELAV